MVIHSPYLIHASTTNTDAEGRMRLSTDIRYQLMTEKIDRASDYVVGDKL